MLDDRQRLLHYLRNREQCAIAQAEAALNISEACLVLAADRELFDRTGGTIRLTTAGRQVAAAL